MAAATRIPKEFVEYDGNELQSKLESTYGVTEPNTVSIFCGDLQSFPGWASLPQEGDNNKQFVYIDTTWSLWLLQGGGLAQNIADVLAHELGHWLGLHQTFDNDCYPGDYVNDTPPAKSEYRVPMDHGNWFEKNIWNPIKSTRAQFWASGIASPNTCGYANDQIENIMDYTAVPSKFTPGQNYRMMIFAFYKQIGRMPYFLNGIIA